jgi:diguanylate cyclase (GGDEF)-like protein/PAS domain S-box-containing protein
VASAPSFLNSHRATQFGWGLIVASAAVVLEHQLLRTGALLPVAGAMGLALALALRQLPAAAHGASIAAGVVPLLLGAPVGATASAVLGGWALVMLGTRLAQHIEFDPRLSRPRDAAALPLLTCAALAPVLVLGQSLGARLDAAWGAGPGAAAASDALQAGVTAAAWSTLSCLVALAWRREFHDAAAAKGHPGVDALLALGLVGCMAAAGLSGLTSPSLYALSLLCAAPLLIAVLLRSSLTVASLALAGSTAVLALAHASLPDGPAAVTPSHLSAPVLVLLGLLLVAHAGRAAAVWRENRWEWALDGSRIGVADWRLQGPEHFVSANWRRLTGHEGGHWTPAHWLSRVHADERALLEEALATVASGAEGRRSLELRMPAGEAWRWFETTLLVLERSVEGRPLRLLATVIDVDDRHEALQRQRLSASLFLHLHEGLLITDEYLRALDLNPAYAQILGVQRDEVLGTVPSLLRPNPPDPLARQQRVAMWQSLHEQGSWRGELLERRRNGELCTLQATITAVPGGRSDVKNHVLVISDITEQRVQRERLERQAHFDELTRLPNRARLSELLGEAMLAADRDGYLLTVCYLDLDHFKPVNDRFGHAAGDRLLAELAGRLRSALRTRETWADVAARLGGDEFVLLLRAGTLEEARLAVERVLRVVAQPYLIDPSAEPVQVTASMGATVYPIDRSDADTLLRHADHAMYGAKQSGRNGYLFFDPEHRRRTEERVMAIGRVQEALDHAEFVLHYQPKVDMRSGRVLGLEALIRWEHPQQGLIAPMQFLPLIENTGLSARVGDWALAQALEHLAAWRRGGLDITVAVNISARHIQEPDFALRLSELLARHPEALAPHVELEMLETAAHADIEATSALMARCRALGVRFALDDFGTGYSTLTYLKRLPVESLKVDRSFVHHMLDDAQDRAIVEGVIGLARTFGCTVVAEGVESPAQARTLLEMGCEVGQGIGIAAPMPASLVAGWVRDYRGMFALASAATPPLAPADEAPRTA